MVPLPRNFSMRTGAKGGIGDAAKDGPNSGIETINPMRMLDEKHRDPEGRGEFICLLLLVTSS
jgi:hypothetical protein